MTHDVGILVSRYILRDCLLGKCPYESFALYDRFARREGLRAVFFSLEDIAFDDLSVRAHIRKGPGCYQVRRIPLPTVIHNRVRPILRDAQRRFFRLRVLPYTQLFNANNRMDKWQMYRCLKNDPVLVPHLPETAWLSTETTMSFLKKHGSIYIKPTNKSLAIGLLRLDPLKHEEKWVASTPRRDREVVYSQPELKAYVRRLSREGKIIVQQPIFLSRVDERPVDLRVAVQRDRQGKWQVSGIVARVGPSNGISTNVAVGGRAVPLSSVSSQFGGSTALPELKEQIERIVLRAAERLSEKMPGLADLGFDVGVDQKGHLWIIEVNGRDLRITFRQAKEWEDWKETFAKPMEYAGRLLRQQPHVQPSKPTVAWLTSGSLPVTPDGGGSVETCVREILPHLAETHQVYLIGKSVRTEHALHVACRTDQPQRYLKEAIGHLRRLRPQVIHIDNRPAFVRQVRVACPHTPITLYLHSKTYAKPPMMDKDSLRESIRLSDRVMTNSNFMAHWLDRLFPRLADKVTVVPLGVNLERFPPIGDPDVLRQRIERRQDMGLENKKVILYVGRVIEQKGLGYLLRALPTIRQKHPDTALVIVGSSRYGRHVETSYAKEIQKQIHSLKEGVHWISHVPHTEVPRYYQMADILVTPSIGHEAFCLVNVEGMATGLPVVSVKTGGIPEVVENGVSGVLVTKDYLAKRLARACIDLFDHPQKMKELSLAARKRVETHYRWELVAERFRDVYQQLMQTTVNATG
ncbi:YheC/YheD family protein [Polycladomyces subterraneus]|uniref:YheC/YheD family protein n=1 Tax=Polycladomyces subterraneus TaxID=1016997 RepID=A0ABT8IM41_9BACL|nr:YheC/YheD family protein [Polycladomyces subterraneus]MDN4593859.1 YheC/YheD family protein [Polycladomyces subterraneus]